MPTDDIDDLIDEIYNEVPPVILPERENTCVFYSFIYLFIYSFFLSFFGLASQQNKDDTQYDERD